MTRRTTSELPDIGDKLEAWRSKMFHNFHFLQSDMVFLSVNIWHPFQWEKLPDFNAFLLTCIHWIRDSRVFPPAEFWLVNSNFRHRSRMQGIYWSKFNYTLHERPYIWTAEKDMIDHHSSRAQLKQLWNFKRMKKHQAWTGFELISNLSAIPVLCSTNSSQLGAGHIMSS